jgi:hypothetical protein
MLKFFSGDARARPDAGMAAARRLREPRRSSGAASAGKRPKRAADRGSQFTAGHQGPPGSERESPEPAYIQRRRQAIAELVEKSASFVDLFLVKLMDAQLAGPKVIIHREWANWLKPTTEVNAVYCARAQLDAPLEFNPRRTALILVRNAGNGAETLQAIVKLSGSFVRNDEPLACHGMEGYEPFPELEQARARRRQALGKTD